MDRFVLRTGGRLFRAARKAACVDLQRLVIIPYKNDKESEFIFVPMIVMVVLAVICIGVSLCFFKWE